MLRIRWATFTSSATGEPPPLPAPPHFVDRRLLGEVRRDRKQRIEGTGRVGSSPELTGSDRDLDVRPDVFGHVDPLRRPERALVIAKGIITIGVRDVIPAGMIRVERHRPIGERASALELAGVDQQDAHEGRGVGVSRIQGQHTIDRMREGVAIPLEEA